MNFSKEDYLNLAACISMAKVEGLQQAAWLVTMHDKLIKAAAPSTAAEDEVKQQSEGLQCHDDVTLTEE